LSETPPPRRPARRPNRWRGNTIGQRFVRSDFFYRFTAGILRGLMAAVRRFGPERAERSAIRMFRLVGPLTRENGMAAASIAAAFPEKSAAERAAILRGAWDNFAKVIVEFVFLEELAASFDPTNPTEGKVTVSGIDQFVALRDDGKPAVIIAAHLANFEILGVVARKFGLKSVLPFRAPGNFRMAEDVLARREALMGHLVENSRGASFEIAAALDRGEHLGMLVDQRLGGGIDLPFFGRPALTNPLAAKFAHQYDCPVHGARTIRMPGGRLHLELTPPIALPRDAEGLIDVVAATAAINLIVEGWVREHPDQWFWLHDRWRH
jgi:Kdo2-lipid IVA lauroyltransferase/acyltransferase